MQGRITDLDNKYLLNWTSEDAINLFFFLWKLPLKSVFTPKHQYVTVRLFVTAFCNYSKKKNKSLVKTISRLGLGIFSTCISHNHTHISHEPCCLLLQKRTSLLVDHQSILSAVVQLIQTSYCTWRPASTSTDLSKSNVPIMKQGIHMISMWMNGKQDS